MADCPSDADLTGFLNESLTPEQVAGLASHVDACSVCQTRLDKLTLDTDGAVARYKDASSSDNRHGRTTPASPNDGTLVLGGPPPLPAAPRLTGLPQVPGFDVAQEIGRGGMGVVYKARHRRLNRLCALKMILAGGAADARTVQRFLFEAEILARVQHSQVVQVFEVDTYQAHIGVPIPYLAMELLEGGSLGARIKEGRLAPREAAELMEGVARGVHAAHLQGVIHRDLKPGNILFTGADYVSVRNDPRSDSGPPTPISDPAFRTPNAANLPKVTDFGLAKFIEAGADLTGSGQVLGTPHYMAPEQAAGAKQIGPPADVYALGAILFECLTGRPPFVGPEPMSVLLKVVNESPPEVQSLRPEVPRALGSIVMRCLRKDARRRYASAGELADDLRRFLENRPTVARPLRRRERLWLWVKRNPAVTALTATLAVVLLAAFGVITWLWVQALDTASNERQAKSLAVLATGRANRSATQAEEALATAKAQKTIADRWQAELEFGRAMASCEERRVADGLSQFVRVVELAEANDAGDLARVARVNLASWLRELPPPHQKFPHTEQPRAVAFHPDRRHLVTVGRAHEIALWDTHTGKRVRSYASPAQLNAPPTPFEVRLKPTYNTVSISPDGKLIAAGDSEGRIMVWNVRSEKFLTTFRAATGVQDVWAVAFAPDGTLWSTNGTRIRQWNLTAWPVPCLIKEGAPPALTPGVINVLVVSRDGKRLYTGDRHGIMGVWDAGTGHQVQFWERGAWIQDLALSPDERQVAVTGPEGHARVFDLASNRVVLEIPLAGAYGNGIAFAPNRPFLVVSDGDGNVRLWHRETGQPIGVPMRFSGEVTRIRFLPGTETFAVPAGDAVAICQVPDPPGDLLWAGRQQRIRGLDLTPKGDYLAVADEETLELFDLKKLTSVQSVFRAGVPPLALRFDPNPDRNVIFRGTRNGFDKLQLFEAERAEPVNSIALHRVYRIEFLPRDAGALVLGSSFVGRFDPVTGEQLAVARPAPDVPAGTDLYVLALRPDAREVLVGFGPRVAFLDPLTLAPLRKGWAAKDEILDAKYTPDGGKVLVARRDNVAELLDAKTGESLIRSMSHAKAVTAVAISPDGKTLATASRDGTARFWDAASGLPLGPPLWHLGPVTHAIFAPTGEHLITATGTGHVMLWDVPPPPLAGSVESLRGSVEKK